MTENMKKFLEAVSKNEILAKKINTMTKEDLLALAKELGVELIEADFEKPDGELEDNELDDVVGGADCCACVLGGGGTKEAMGGDVCACVVYGHGGEYMSGEYWCCCVGGGVGGDISNDSMFS
ncbi:MAG: Nif11-like leader peptide family RiPP precursor [Clostridia bacterium]|nr:Nif11-like leader peptide family RiPP precursor [Clostridia bacterium]